VSAYEQADTDGEAVKVDIPMADVSRGKKIGSGSFGDVFEGTWKGQRVILKERKMTGPGKKYFDAEAALNRRLKSAKGVAPFLGVAGANAFLVWKDEGRNTLDAVLGGGGGGGLSLAAAAAAAASPPRWASATRAARCVFSPSSSCRL
jgi:predicted Ser/Thr protein kinase